jgi:hypothetical protein
VGFATSPIAIDLAELTRRVVRSTAAATLALAAALATGASFRDSERAASQGMVAFLEIADVQKIVFCRSIPDVQKTVTSQPIAVARKMVAAVTVAAAEINP